MEIYSGKIYKGERVVIYGQPGIGKSTIASMFPDAVFSDVEGSTEHMDVRRLATPTSWMALNQQADYIKRFKPFKTWIIDTIDWAELLCKDHILSTKQIRSIEDVGYGKGWTMMWEEWCKFLNKLTEIADVGINVVLLAHATIRKVDQPDEMGSYDRWELKLYSKNSASTKEWATLMLFANFKVMVVQNSDKKGKGVGGQRVMYSSFHPAWDAKNRHNLPPELSFDFGAIAHIFQGKPASSPNDRISMVNDYSLPPVQQSAPVSSPHLQASAVEQTQATIPQQSAEQTQQQTFMAGLEVKYPEVEIDYSNLPQALVDLMKPQKVTKEEIQKVVASKGYFPITMPVQNYPTDFIQGVLVAAWPQVSSMIMDSRQPALNITANDLPY